MFTHGGHVWGFRAMLSWFPDVDFGVFIVLTGRDDDYFYRTTLQNFIFDVYHNFTPYLNVSSICNYPEPWLSKNGMKIKPNFRRDLNLSQSMEKYLGTFDNPAYGSINIQEHKESNKLKLVYGYITFILFPKSIKDEFFGDSVGLSAYLFDIYV